jgi:hypothetical protein
MTTFSKIIKKSGSTHKMIEVSRDGKPFGALWTWMNTKYDTHPWHYKTLNGEYGFFYGKDGLKKAKEAISNL